MPGKFSAFPVAPSPYPASLAVRGLTVLVDADAGPRTISSALYATLHTVLWRWGYERETRRPWCLRYGEVIAISALVSLLAGIVVVEIMDRISISSFPFTA